MNNFKYELQIVLSGGLRDWVGHVQATGQGYCCSMDMRGGFSCNIREIGPTSGRVAKT